MLINFAIKLGLLLLYLVLLLVLLRLLDVSAWYETGFLAAQLVDPLSLSVRRLKLLLESRGLSHEGFLEREELVKLADKSGDITEADLNLLEQSPQTDLRNQKSSEFTGRAHFLEEVEDKKDSVWLIQVIPSTHPLLGASTWNSVIQRVSIFGIRTGIFFCARDHRFCRSKGWTKPLLLLAMPDGEQYKDHVELFQLTTPTKASGVVDWVNHQLSSKLSEIEDEDEVCDHWLEFKSKEETKQNLQSVIFTPYEKPSILFSALSMQYSGRIKFGYYRKGKVRCIDLKPDSKTHLVVSQHGDIHIYGHRVGEFLNMDSLNLYYHSLVPEINDVFIVSFIAVNLFCFMDLFLTSGGLAKIFLCFFWQLAKLNLLFILLWLPLQWLCQLPIIAPLSNFFWWAVQVFFQTSIAGQLRQDWLIYSHHWIVVCCIFSLYCFVCGWFVKKCHRQSQEDTLSSIEWIRLAFHQWHLFMIRPRNMWHQGGPQISTSLEEGLDLFVERTAPDLWLHPVITGEYIHNLPRWKYGGLRKTPGEVHQVNHLCSSCQSAWKKYFCTTLEEDHQEKFERSCERIQQMFAEGKVTSKKLNQSCVFDLKAEYHDEAGTETDVVQKQPTVGFKSITGIYECEKVFCQDCLDLICHGGTEAACLDLICHGGTEESACIVHGGSVQQPAFLHPEVLGSISTPTAIDKGGSHKVSSTSDDHSHEVFDPWPEEILQSSECAICLEVYHSGVSVCGLPCGHAFHFDCVQCWLCGGKHCCPTCRWPAFKRKPNKLSKYKE